MMASMLKIQRLISHVSVEILCMIETLKYVALFVCFLVMLVIKKLLPKNMIMFESFLGGIGIGIYQDASFGML